MKQKKKTTPAKKKEQRQPDKKQPSKPQPEFIGPEASTFVDERNPPVINPNQATRL